MGRRLARALAERGNGVRVLCLPGDPAAAGLASDPDFSDRLSVAYGDITRPETLAPALLGVGTVFHLAAVLLSPGRPEIFQAVNADGTRNVVAAAAAAGVRHFIYVSSISVEYPMSNAYARSKLEGERRVKESGIPYTIVRPSLAYGNGGALEFMAFVRYLMKGPIVFLPLGGRSRKSPVHIEDLVSGFLALPGKPEALGRTYVFSGGDAVTLREMATLLLAHMGRPKPVIGVPAWACLAGVACFWIVGKAFGVRTTLTYQSYTGLVQDAAPAHGEAREDLGYRPRSFREGLATLDSLRGALRSPG